MELVVVDDDKTLCAVIMNPTQLAIFRRLLCDLDWEHVRSERLFNVDKITDDIDIFHRNSSRLRASLYTCSMGGLEIEERAKEYIVKIS